MPLAESAYERLRNMILSGELAPGSGITESGIVERLAIGKTPVREAMRRLVLEGLLDVTPRMGYTVAGISIAHVLELFDLLTIVEVAAAQAAAEHLDDAALQRLEALGDIGYDPDDDVSMLRFIESNAAFHNTIATASGNRRLADLIARLMTESRRFAQIANLSGAHGQAVTSQHKSIVDALRSGNRERIADAVGAHLRHSAALVLDSLHAVSAAD